MVNFIYWVEHNLYFGISLWNVSNFSRPMNLDLMAFFGQKKPSCHNNDGTYIHTEEEFTHHRTKMEYFGLYPKTVYESNFGCFAFWIFVTRTNNNVACLIFFKCEWQRGSPPIWFGSHKKWTFTKWKHRAHSSIIKQPSRNKMKPRKICMRLANKLEMVACHSRYIGSYSKVSQRWKKYRTCMNKMEILTRNKANKT